MAPKPRKRTTRSSAASAVGERVARAARGTGNTRTSPTFHPRAVATTLSRLAREGTLKRVGKGVAPTSFGMSIPGASDTTAQLVGATVHPASLSAANVLGLSTQNPGRQEYATPASFPATARAPRASTPAVRRTRSASEERWPVGIATGRDWNLRVSSSVAARWPSMRTLPAVCCCTTMIMDVSHDWIGTAGCRPMRRHRVP
jgi:hypothetical protein